MKYEIKSYKKLCEGYYDVHLVSKPWFRKPKDLPSVRVSYSGRYALWPANENDLLFDLDTVIDANGDEADFSGSGDVPPLCHTV